MLDARSSAVLGKINELCGEGFKIAEEGELLSCLPGGTGEEVRRIVGFLEEQRLVEIKYAEDGVYCLCPLPEGRLYFENARRAQYEETCRRRGYFFTALAGAFLGALTAGLIMFALWWWLR